MYSIYFNDESEANELILNFEDLVEQHSEYLDDCYDYLELALKKFNIHSDRVDSYQDYMYFINQKGSSEREFGYFEDYLRELFDSLEEKIEEELQYDEDDEYDEDDDWV